jgi:hypothetical protein
MLLRAVLALPYLAFSAYSAQQYATLTLPPFEISYWDVSVATVVDKNTVYNLVCNNPECEWMLLDGIAYSTIDAFQHRSNQSFTRTIVEDSTTTIYTGYVANVLSDHGPGELSYTATGVQTTSIAGQPKESMTTVFTGVLPAETYTLPVSNAHVKVLNVLEL